MIVDTSVDVVGGLATLGPDATRLLERVDRAILAWADGRGAERWSFPPLMAVADLASLDYLRNFPHLGSVVTRLRPDQHAAYSENGSRASVPASDLVDGQFMLPSAACYNVYLHLRNVTLPVARQVTTVARCFRNEERYEGLSRLWGFTMREVVCVGNPDAVREHLEVSTAMVRAFGASLDLTFDVEVAEDPFYGAAPRRLMQKLSPVKHEFRYRGEVAVASVNIHRNFFGERCNIRLDDGSFAFSGCLAFGLERWLAALIDRHGSAAAALKRLDAVCS